MKKGKAKAGDELRKVIRRAGVDMEMHSMAKIADALGMPATTFNERMADPMKFRVGELILLDDVLGCSGEMMRAIFGKEERR